MLASTKLQVAEALRRELGGVDDEKIGKIIAYVDRVGSGEINRTLLDSLRDRLATLRPSRPLRLSRLLFIPLDPLIVNPAVWRPGSLRVPRTALTPFTAAVTAQLGPMLALVNAMIKDCSSDAVDTIEEVGGVLWPRAGDILAQAQVPSEWAETGLPDAVFGALARPVAAVLRRGPPIYRLMRNALTGQTEADAELVGRIVAGLAQEPAEAAAMVTQLVLLHAPQASVHLRRCISAARDSAENVALSKAMSQGVNQCLNYLESDANFVRAMANGTIRDASEQVKFVAKLLLALESDPSATMHRVRIRVLRDKLDHSSRDCFARGIREQVTEPLAAMTEMVSAEDQRRLEASARELRALENNARQFSDSASYDLALRRSSDAVRHAFSIGTISVARGCRLIEILSGAEAAIAFYQNPAEELRP